MTVKGEVTLEQVSISMEQPQSSDQQNGGGGEAPKTKAQLKAERRAKQEAQRAAKLKERGAAGSNQPKQQQQKQQQPKQQQQQKQQQSKGNTNAPVEQKVTEKSFKKAEEVTASSKVEILSHLKQYDKISLPTSSLSYSNSPVHPAFVKLGVQYASELVTGSNARCAALICAVKIYIQQYRCPKSKEIRAHLNIALKPSFNYLSQCRKMSVSMENFVKHIKYLITKIEPEMPHDAAREELLMECDNFFKENIYLAAKAITNTTVKRIKDGDTILIFSRSQLILHILLTAKEKGRKFRVMVVDSRPDLTGVNACERLTAAGISCSYVYINSVTYVMKEITKVLLAADAVLANGYVLGPCGTAMIGLIAHKFNKPVIVCCEKYKFSERVQTDSILFNELADPDDLLQSKTASNTSSLVSWRENPKLSLVNLVFDVTPPNLVSIVITEVAELPCTSAPVIIRRDTENNRRVC